MVGASVEMTRGAGDFAVASHLKVPEQSLAQRDQRILIAYVSRQIGWLGDLDSLERGDWLRGPLRKSGNSRHQQGQAEFEYQYEFLRALYYKARITSLIAHSAEECR